MTVGHGLCGDQVCVCVQCLISVYFNTELPLFTVELPLVRVFAQEDTHARVQAERRGFMAGGQYGPTGTRGVYKSGETMDVSFLLSAYHAGWVEFRLCVLDESNPTLTQECLNEHVLKIHPSTPYYEDVTNYTGMWGLRCA